jgi:hypothetical protein
MSNNYIIILFLLIILFFLNFRNQIIHSKEIISNINLDLNTNNSIFLPVSLKPTNIILMYLFEQFYLGTKIIYKYDINNYVRLLQVNLLNKIRSYADWLSILNGITKLTLDSIKKSRIEKIKLINHQSVNYLYQYLYYFSNLNKIPIPSDIEADKYFESQFRKSKNYKILKYNTTTITLIKLYLLVKNICYKYSPYNYILKKSNKTPMEKNIKSVLSEYYDKNKNEYYEISLILNSRLKKGYLIRNKNDTPLYSYINYIYKLEL